MNFFDDRLPPRFWKKCVPEPNSGCWLWIGASQRLGYGVINTKGLDVSRLAHRFAYHHLVGPIPDGLVIDHLCRTHCCVNPSHMEPVEHGENTRRGLAPVVAKLRPRPKITHCKRGHALSDSAPYRSGRHRCRTCMQEWHRNKWLLKNPTARKYKPRKQAA